MRDEFVEWVSTYPSDRAAGSKTKVGTRSYQAIMKAVPAALTEHIVHRSRFKPEGSTGSGNWTDISWVAVVDHLISPTTQEGFYITYLLSRDGKRLVLSMQQGCKTLSEEIGKGAAMVELQRRAAVMRARAPKDLKRLSTTAPIDLGTPRSHRLGPLYQAGHVLGRSYDVANLPPEAELVADFREAIRAQKHIAANGGSATIESMIGELIEDGLTETNLSYVKRYALHRVAERSAAHAKAVKDYYPDVCMGCDKDMRAVYGEDAERMLDAHHLISIGSLAENEHAAFTVNDFALLCPNCHRMIHRLVDSSDVKALRDLLGR
ncbi:MrcB family domain-containing protein [Maricaulis sp.]|uniref:MrcB family domain-containing protein n=1 Tax=Maricaulis sp. TaxID=1486257 RepID=UPI003A907D38